MPDNERSEGSDRDAGPFDASRSDASPRRGRIAEAVLVVLFLALVPFLWTATVFASFIDPTTTLKDSYCVFAANLLPFMVLTVVGFVVVKGLLVAIRRWRGTRSPEAVTDPGETLPPATWRKVTGGLILAYGGLAAFVAFFFLAGDIGKARQLICDQPIEEISTSDLFRAAYNQWLKWFLFATFYTTGVWGRAWLTGRRARYSIGIALTWHAVIIGFFIFGYLKARSR